MKLLITWTLFLMAVASAQAGPQPPVITLPPDAEVVTIVGNGFKLDVKQLAQMQSDWKAVAEELQKDDQVEEQNTGDDGAKSDTQNDLPQDDEANSTELPPAEDGESNPNGPESEDEKNYGFLEDDLHTWIEDRATALADRVERYSDEIRLLKQGPRVVSQILLLNTLYDLENLTKENIKSLKWIKNKLRWTTAIRGGVTSEVSQWVALKIEQNEKIERSVVGKNDPGNQWLTNVQAIKRIMHEQRFSDSIRDSIVKFLGDEFNMMQRSRVYDINKPAKILDDGLYYYQAKGRIPAYFPFFSQDSIINGSQL